MPLTLDRGEFLYVFKIPSDGILGEAHDEYKKVEILKFDRDMNAIPGPSGAEIFSVGRLGTLHGGLLHLADFRAPASRSDIAALQLVDVEGKIKKSRSGIEQTEAAVSSKKQKREERVASHQGRVDFYERKVNDATRLYSVWNQIWSSVADSNTKTAGQQWNQFFLSIAEEDLDTTPHQFLVDEVELPYGKMLMELALYVSTLEKDLEKHNKQLKNSRKRKHETEQTIQKQDSKALAKIRILQDETAQKAKREEDQKRRRQIWHAKHQFTRKSGRPGQGPKKARKTKDGGQWEKPLSKQRRIITIEDKLKVVDYYLQLKKERQEANKEVCAPEPRSGKPEDKRAYVNAKKKARQVLRRNIQRECAEKFPHILGKGQACKWHAVSEREQWRHLPAPVRCRVSTTGNSWRLKLGLPLRGRAQGGGVPWALQVELDTLIMEMTAGASDVSERRDVVTTDQIATTIQNLVQDWNKNIANAIDKVKAHNQMLSQEMDAGRLSPQTVMQQWLPVPTLVQQPSVQWARWFLKEFGWSLLARGDGSQGWLAYNHCDMVATRAKVEGLISKRGCHPALILNYDQLWRSCYQWGGRLLYKHRKNKGMRAKKKRAPKTMGKKHHAVKGARRGITAITSTWSDGSRGPIAFCIPEGRMKVEEICAFNSRYEGRAFVLTSGTGTHFTSAETMLTVFEQLYSVALQNQRHKHSLDEKSKAAFICDAWTGFFSTAAGQGLRRDNFYKLHNIEPPFRPPGGWSYHGQPCDQLHSCFRKAIRRKDLCSLGMEADLRHRQRH
ncbi:Uncharacterized protein (Fragment) [Durusdinium trenchii]|uniref:Uncharacterized protein n=1 Tax=Durusdinium trenchii TaxID=1381693 RepID=A0ABP0J9I6_9DINO